LAKLIQGVHIIISARSLCQTKPIVHITLELLGWWGLNEQLLNNGTNNRRQWSQWIAMIMASSDTGTENLSRTKLRTRIIHFGTKWKLVGGTIAMMGGKLRI
jgi:hypothetical protein